MDVEQCLAATVPLGLVSSTLLYGSATSASASASASGEDDELPPPLANEVLVAVCSSGRLMAFLASCKAQFVVTEDGPSIGQGQSPAYQTSYEGLLHVVRDPSKLRPSATAVVVIPISFGTKPGAVHTSSIVVVGFSDGYIRIYSKTGLSVLTQLLHTEPVVRITCTAGGRGQRTAHDQGKLVVLFRSAMCVVEGKDLVEGVRAGVSGKGEESGNHPAPLRFQKWHLAGQSSTRDVVLLAQSTPSTYDHLRQSSLGRDAESVVVGGPVPEERLIAVGEGPMIGVYKITKGAGSINMSKLVSAAASAVLGKLSQASGWLGWGGSSSPTPKDPTDMMKVATNLPMSTNIPDERRTVYSLTPSPMGDLAAAVDCFGRVLLLDCGSVVVRRMWKGYRDAQCGWLLVHETLPKTSPSGKKTPKPSTALRKAQCLCIYAARRGIVELWPAHAGRRIAAFQVGKGCRLLYSPHGVFSLDHSGAKRGPPSKLRATGIRDTTLLLCPNGQVITFSVPFPALARVGDPRSHDVPLLQKLSPALQSGDTEVILQLFSAFKSGHCMKEAIDILISTHPLRDIPSDFTVKILNLALSRINPTDPSHQQLLRYIAGVRQVVQLCLSLEDLCTDAGDRDGEAFPSPEKLHELLSKLCGTPIELARSTASGLRKYFEQFKPAKMVKKRMEMKDLLHCFDLPKKIGGAVLSASSEERQAGTLPERESVPLKLKRGLSRSTLLDLGCALFLSVIGRNVPVYDIKSAFQSCGIPAHTLLSLLCRVFLSGSYGENNPSILLRRLHRATTVVVARDSGGSDGETDLWEGVCLQCAQGSNVGHALLASLLYQKVATSTGAGEADSQTESEDSPEAWETVTAERERWVRMAHHLEVLVLLSNVIGVGAMRAVPPVPTVTVAMEEEEGPVANILEHRVQLLRNDDLGGVCAALLESTGPQLIAHCVSKWLVESRVPADFVARLPSDPNDVQESDGAYRRMVFQLSPLLKLLPQTLSRPSLLTHCGWQAAYQWRDDTQKNCQMCHQTLQYISQLSSVCLLQGLVGFLWNFVFESSIMRVLDSLKRGTSRDSGILDLISVCRNLFGFLYQLSNFDPSNDRPEEALPSSIHDVLVITQPPGSRCLQDIVQAYPALSPALSKTYFELLLLTEMALQLGATVNVAAFFPTWVRGVLKKGVFSVNADARREGGSVPVQLQQKRAKVSG